MTHTFGVWAPNAARVDVVIGATRRALEATPAPGWFEAIVDDAGPGTRYQFSLDGGPPRPDPRSPFQPEGVHGVSEVVDRSAFAWTDDAWTGVDLPKAIIYELHVGTFTGEGTFEAAIAKLPHLVDLGVDTVELMPLHQFPGVRGWGYDGAQLFAPHAAYGGPSGLQQLVNACHAAGLAVIVDVVYNHLGPIGNYLAEFGPYFTDKYATPWGSAVNLDDRGSDEVRRFFLDNALLWLRDYHCDGLRVDAVHALVDTSALHFLEELSQQVDRLEDELGRRLWVIAESDLNDPRVIAPTEVGGYGVDAQWSDDFHHALHAALTGERDGYYADFGSLSDVATALRRGFVYAGQHSAVRDRRHGRAPLGLPAHRFLGYLQNHDQIGNRATGERTSHLLSTDRLKIGAALVLTAPFVPLLFMGEEWGAGSPFQYFTDHPDPELGAAVTEGRRREFASFGWNPADIPDPQDEATFARSRLDWTEPEAGAHAELLRWHRELIALRRRFPEFTDGFDAVDVEVDEDAGRLSVRRGRLRVLANLGAEPWTVAGAGRPLLSSPPGTGRTVPPDGLVILG